MSKAKKKAEPTAYAILEAEGGEGTGKGRVWREVDALTAHGNERSILERWAKAKKKTGTFKLVPARSWKGGHRFFEQTVIKGEAI